MSRRTQTGLLLEVFMLILILVLFLMFWGSYSKSTFLAGFLSIDDSAFKHTCSNMVQVLVGSDYIINFQGGEDVYYEIVAYLKMDPSKNRVPDATYFYNKIIHSFPDLEGRIGVTVQPTAELEPGFVRQRGQRCPALLRAFLGESLKCAVCEFPLYSTDEDLSAIVILEVLL
jgi:hypothetical protein